jgi:hypothetical protein
MILTQIVYRFTTKIMVLTQIVYRFTTKILFF